MRSKLTQLDVVLVVLSLLNLLDLASTLVGLKNPNIAEANPLFQSLAVLVTWKLVASSSAFLLVFIMHRYHPSYERYVYKLKPAFIAMCVFLVCVVVHNFMVLGSI